MVRLSHQDYKVGWFCALPLELDAAIAMLDRRHDSLTQHKNDDNAYVLGNIGDHNVVLAALPDKDIGTNSAGHVAAHLLRTFDAIKVGLVVGIGGGVPTRHDIRLGDVVVSRPDSNHGGVYQFDYGKNTEEGFERSGRFLSPPSRAVRSAVSLLRAFHRTPSQNYMSRYLSSSTNPNLPQRFNYPVGLRDDLFKSEYRHVGKSTACDECDRAYLVDRKGRPEPASIPVVHYGIVASGNQVIKNAGFRDGLSKDHDIICFEMESAGIQLAFPCLVIRGICDYADSHKNNCWKDWAAATAAAYAREVIRFLAKEDVVLETATNTTSYQSESSPSDSNRGGMPMSQQFPVSPVTVRRSLEFRSGSVYPRQSIRNRSSLFIPPFLRPAKEKLHVLYQRLLSQNSFGNALYWPVDSTQIFPGTVGYFNQNGHWKKLPIQATSEEQVSNQGGIISEDTGTYLCGVITSSNVRNIDIDVQSTSIASFSSSSSTEFRIEVTGMKKGAALLNCDSVIRKTVVGSVESLKKWGKANAKTLFEKEPDTREHGFVVVTSTFRTKKCALKCWPKVDNSDTSIIKGGSTSVNSERVPGYILTRWEQSGWIRVPVNEDSVNGLLASADL